MKIVFFVSSMQTGGAERVASLLCNYWAKSGHVVHLVMTHSRISECHYALDRRVQLTRLANENLKVKKTDRFRRLVSMYRLIKGSKPDIVVSFLTDVNIAVLIVTLFLNARVIISERVYPPLHKLPLLLEIARRLTYRRADYVVLQNSQSLNWLKSICPNSAAAVIPNPVEWPISDTYSGHLFSNVRDSGKKMILGVGRLELQKGFDILIAAFALIEKVHPDWILVIVGEGSQRHKLEEQIKKLVLSEKVLLCGKVRNISACYQNTEIFVLSSRYEGFPNALLEAMASGCAVVSFDCMAGPRDIIVDQENGYLVDLDHGVIGIGSAIDRLIRDESTRRRLAENAIAVRNTYSIGTITKRWDRIFEC
jgi:GalNAc-alpha-(1->4)-GalNAc-alpha-(1->3)-diNAcBac-PP-undecaprenol alpha-1,4-N-acetyl-D-galactosaminyltransferase